MQQRMQEQMEQQETAFRSQNATSPDTSKSGAPSGEYIDFEEIK